MLSIQASSCYDSITNTNNSGETLKLKQIHCRFCAEIKSNHNELLYISDNCNDYEKLIGMLNFFKMDFIDLSETNSLPKTICGTCYNSFHEAFVFFNKVKESQALLSSLYNEVVSEAEAFIKLESESALVKSEPDNDENNTLVSQEITPLHEALSLIEDDDPIALNVESNDISPVEVPIIMEPPTLLLSNIDLVASPSFGDVQDQSMESPNLDEVQQYNSELDHNKHDHIRKGKIKSKAKVFVPMYNGVPIFENYDEIGSWTSYCWRCSHCNEVFPTLNDLRNHSKENHETCFALDCSDCSEEFYTFFEFIEHVREHRSHLKNYCKYCDRKFDASEKCIAHEINHTKGYTIACELCGELCTNSDAYARHKEAVPKEKITRKRKPVLPKLLKKIDKNWTWENYEWTCQECLLRAPTVGSLRDHVREVHNKCFAMKCIDCEDVMMNFKMFVEHVRKHRPHLRRWCLYCNKAFPTFKKLSFHIPKHYEGRSLCHYCGEIFADECSLKEHLVKYSDRQETPKPKRRRRNPEDITKKTCKICNKVFSNGSGVLKHIRLMHSDIKPTVACQFCGKNVCELYLNQHIRSVHNNSRDFECDICHQKFRIKSRIQTHIVLTHLKEKRHQCDVCGKKFGTKSAVDIHKRIHSNKLPFSCNMCDKAFRTKSNMKKHFLQHTGERPYKCDFCYKSFTCTGNRQKHMLRVHKQEMLKED